MSTDKNSRPIDNDNLDEQEDVESENSQNSHSSDERLRNFDQLETISNCSWSSTSTNRDILSSDKIIEQMIRPMFDNGNYDECVQLLMNFQKWFTDTQEQHNKSIINAINTKRDHSKFGERLKRIEKLYNHFNPLAQSRLTAMEERRMGLTDDFGDDFELPFTKEPEKDLNTERVPKETSFPSNRAAEINKFSSFNIIKPPKPGGFDISNDTFSSPQSKHLNVVETVGTTIRRTPTQSEEDLMNLSNRITDRIGSLQSQNKNLNLGTTFNTDEQPAKGFKRTLTNSAYKLTTQSTPKNKSNIVDRTNSLKSIDKKNNRDYNGDIRKLKQEREKLIEELEQLIRSPYFDPNEMSIKKREERLVEISGYIDDIHELMGVPHMISKKVEHLEIRKLIED